MERGGLHGGEANGRARRDRQEPPRSGVAAVLQEGGRGEPRREHGEVAEVPPRRRPIEAAHLQVTQAVELTAPEPGSIDDPVGEQSACTDPVGGARRRADVQPEEQQLHHHEERHRHDHEPGRNPPHQGDRQRGEGQHRQRTLQQLCHVRSRDVDR